MNILTGAAAIDEHMRSASAPRGPDPADDRVASYDFELPEELIAQRPAPRRDGSRLMVLPRRGGAPIHLRFPDLVEALQPGDLLVVNDTRVIPARLLGFRPGGGRAELLLVRPVAGGDGRVWEAMVRPAARLGAGTVIRFGDEEPWTAEVEAEGEEGLRRVRLSGPGSFEDFLARRGQVPLPPYIARGAGADEEDRARYQTVYAREPGAVAAPTAGLHFTPGILEALARRGVTTAPLTLHVGPGTFQPVRVERLTEHPMHREPYRVPLSTARALVAALQEGRRVVAVGTTVCRAIEAWDEAGRPEDGAWRETRLLIWPGRPPAVTSGLLTNFHLPRSTLIALVAAFAGRERVLAAYREAAARGYRFYSYGDAMLLV